MTTAAGLSEAVRAFVAGLDAAGVEFMVIGGIAVIARGVARDTDDVDATVWGPTTDLAALVQELGKHQIAPRIDDALAFAAENQVLLLRHEPTGTTLDLSMAWLPFERDALDAADRLQFAGVRPPVATADDLIIYKAVAWRDRDRADIERLVRRHGADLDTDRILGRVGEFCELLGEPDRLADVRRLLEDPLKTS